MYHLSGIQQPEIEIGRNDGSQRKGDADAEEVAVFDLVTVLPQDTDTVMLAEAPMGVQLPPRVAPESRPKYRGVGSMPSAVARPAITGIMVAT